MEEDFYEEEDFCEEDQSANALKELGNVKAAIEECKNSEIPAFGKFHLKLSGGTEEAMIFASKTCFKELFKSKLPSNEEITSALNTISTSRGLVKYNRIQFERIRSMGPEYARLFSDTIIRPFVVCRRFFDAGRFCDFVDYALLLHRELLNMLDFSSTGDEYLTMDDFGDYLKDRINKTPSLKKRFQQDEDTIEFYIQFLLEGTYIQLDQLGRNRLSAVDIACSRQFIFVIEIEKTDSELSLVAFSKVYKDFSKLSNSNGLVPPESFKRSCERTFSDAFVKRVFEVLMTFDGCLDFGGYLHIAQNIDNVDDNAHLFFQILDVDGDGVFGPQDVLYFFQGMAKEKGCSLPFDIFLQEVLDNFSSHQLGVTFDEFVKSGNGIIAVQILSDVSEFSTYVATNNANEV